MALAARDRGPGFKFVSSPKSSYMSSPIKTADSKLDHVAGGPSAFLILLRGARLLDTSTTTLYLSSRHATVHAYIVAVT